MAVERLLIKMANDKECLEYIKNNWNALYNDLKNTPNDLSELNGFAAMALEDYEDNLIEDSYFDEFYGVNVRDCWW